MATSKPIPKPTPITAYGKRAFTADIDGKPATFDVYTRGEGAPVLILQELPGIGPQTLQLADRLVEAGFQVSLPHLFGPLGKIAIGGNIVRVLCMRREFAVFAQNRSSPIVDWLKALCRDIKARTGAPGVGTIGMCLTGNFAISLMADDAVLAGVASQPGLPIGAAGALHMSPAEIACVKDRLDQTGPMMALRFDKDPMVNARKFDAIDTAFNGDKERVRLRVLPGGGHSVLTLHFIDEEGHPTRQALAEVIAYFKQRLGSA